MSKLPSVAPGEIIASGHINDIMEQSANRYASIADRTASNPTPQAGELAYMAAEGSSPERVAFFDGADWVGLSESKQFDSAFVAAQATRTLASYGSIDGDGPAVTLSLKAGFVKVTWSASLWNTDAAGFAHMSFKLTNATGLASSDNNSIAFQSPNPFTRADYGSSRIVAVNDGTTSFTAEYSAPTGGTATFRRRSITVVEL